MIHAKPVPRRKRPEDTPEGCRAHAAAARDQAAAAGAEQARRRFEQSAAAWTARAETLEAQELSFLARAGKAAK